MRKICLLLLLVPSASGLLTSCTPEEPWPPFADRVTRAFYDNRAEFTELENRLLESKYFDVRLLGETDALGMFVDAAGMDEEEIVPDGHIWADLFITTGTLGVRRLDGTTGFATGMNPFVSAGGTEPRKVGRLGIHHDDDLFSGLDQCDDSHRLLPDGRCYVPLSDDWGVVYFWRTN